MQPYPVRRGRGILHLLRGRDERAKQVADQFDATQGGSHAVFLTNERYREFLAQHLEGPGVKVSVSMRGRRIDE